MNFNTLSEKMAAAVVLSTRLAMQVQKNSDDFLGMLNIGLFKLRNNILVIGIC